MYIPVVFEWNNSPSFSTTDQVGFLLEAVASDTVNETNALVIAAGIPFGRLSFTYEGFSRILPGDYIVSMTVNGELTGEQILFHVALPNTL